MKIELDLSTLNVITAALRGQQAAIEGVLQNLQAQVMQAQKPPENVVPIKENVP